MLDSPLRYIVVAAAGPSLMRVSVEARHRNGGNRGSLCTPVLITYREQWAREQDQHRRREENQNIVVYTFASICQRVLPPSALLFPGKRACTRPSLRNISPLLGKNATGRSPYRVYPYPAYSTASRIALSLYLSIYVSIYLFLRASLRTESNLYHLNFSPRVNSHFFLRKCDCFIVISLSCNNFYIFTRISHIGIDIIV